VLDRRWTLRKSPADSLTSSLIPALSSNIAACDPIAAAPGSPTRINPLEWWNAHHLALATAHANSSGIIVPGDSGCWRQKRSGTQSRPAGRSSSPLPGKALILQSQRTWPRLSVEKSAPGRMFILQRKERDHGRRGDSVLILAHSEKAEPISTRPRPGGPRAAGRVRSLAAYSWRRSGRPNIQALPSSARKRS